MLRNAIKIIQEDRNKCLHASMLSASPHQQHYSTSMYMITNTEASNMEGKR
jgi:hypothetical protein